jgi:hypothetical protein
VRDDRQDHPYVAHYDWSAVGSVEPPGAVDEQERAALAQHADDRVALEAGHTLRLWLAVPLVLWSFLGVAVFVLMAVILVLAAAGRGDLDDLELSWSLGLFVGLALLLTVASIWSALLLIRDLVRPGAWLAVLLCSLTVAVAGIIWLSGWEDASSAAVASVALAVYLTLVAGTQLARCARLREAAARSERYAP